MLDIRLKMGELDGVDILLRALAVSIMRLRGIWREIKYWGIRHTDAKTLPLKMRQRWSKTFSMPFARC